MNLVKLGELLLRIGVNELFDDHVPAAHSDDELAVQDFSVDLSRTEDVVPATQFLDGHRAVGLMNVLSDHLVKEVALGDDLRGWSRDRAGVLFDAVL